MTGTPANFVIIGYTDDNGKVTLTAMSNVCRVDIDQEHDYDDLHSWGGNTIRQLQRNPRIAVRAEGHREDMVQLVADDAASAWRRLFNLWVPPGAALDEDSRNAINAHYAFNPPTPVPSRKVSQHVPGAFAGGGSGGIAWTDPN